VSSPQDSPPLIARFNKLPKWARDYIHKVHTFSGAKEVEELTQLRDQRRTLRKKIDSLTKLAL
jgi:hypothetical protein